MNLSNISPKKLSCITNKQTFLSAMALRFYPEPSMAQKIVNKFRDKTKLEIVNFFQNLYESNN